jgi:hypothetical protein
MIKNEQVARVIGRCVGWFGFIKRLKHGSVLKCRCPKGVHRLGVAAFVGLSFAVFYFARFNFTVFNFTVFKFSGIQWGRE